MRPRKHGGDKKRGLLRPKDIPGRFTPEQRKLRLMAGHENRLFEKFSRSKPPAVLKGKAEVNQQHRTQELFPTSNSALKSILKVKRNEYDDVIIDLTTVEEDDLFGSEDDDDSQVEYLSWEEDYDSLEEHDSVEDSLSSRHDSTSAPERLDDSAREGPENPTVEDLSGHDDELFGMTSSHFLPSWILPVPTTWKSQDAPKEAFSSKEPTTQVDLSKESRHNSSTPQLVQTE